MGSQAFGFLAVAILKRYYTAKGPQYLLLCNGGTDRGDCYFSPVSLASSFSDQRREPLVKPSGDPKMLTPDHASETSVKLDIK